ncbi:hypothetical protein HMPREF1589_04676, partial [Escherichia coli 113290]
MLRFRVFFPILYVLVVKFTFAVVQIPDWHGDIAFRSKNLYLPPFFVWRGYVSENQNSQNDNQPGAGQIPEDS